ncbi:MAG: hypothetical protein AAF614_42580 [Chloroflexota bacterium]
MTTLDLSQSLITAEADVTAGDWGKAAAGLSLDIQAQATLNRGIDVQLGASALAELSASFSKFVAADAELRAAASARLKGQIQAPLDLFNESGMAVRLQAVAEASILVRLALGLNFGDFLALAEQDPNIQGVPAELLRIFLEESEVQAGVLGKAAFSAMAYANLVISGRLVATDDFPAGFTVAGEYGMGLKGGVGFQLFANIGFKDTGRAIRRTVDVLVDAAMTEMQAYVPDPAQREILSFFRAPAKMVLRAGFEVGYALAESAPTFATDGGDLAERTVQVLMEELQRFILEQLNTLGTLLFKRALAELNIPQKRWEDSKPQREHFAQLLRALPPDPFDVTDANNVAYWAELVSAGIAVAVELGGDQLIEASWVEPLTIMWSSVQLLFAITNRVSSALARVSFFGAVDVGANTNIPAFAGNLATDDAPPPSLIREHINDRLGRNANDPITQDFIVEYLVSDVIIDKLVAEFPEIKPILNIVMGDDSSSFVEAAQTILRNASSFVDNQGNLDPQGTLEVLSLGMQAYMRDRVEDDLRPLLIEIADEDENLVLYIDDVILTTFTFTVETVFQRIINYGFGNITGKQALKEACSSICMKLFGRSLVVTYDVLMAFAMAEVSTQFANMAEEADQPNGLAEQLAQLINLQSEQDFIAEVMEDTLQIAAQVFTPLPDPTRARIRNLLYIIIDSVPPNPGDDWLDDLLNNPAIQEATYEAMFDLTIEIGGILAENLMRFLSLVLIKIAEKSLAILYDYVDAGLEQIEEWLEELAEVAQALYSWFLSLPQQFAALAAEIEAAIDEALDLIADTLNLFANEQRQQTLINAIETKYQEIVMAVLTDNPIYQNTPEFPSFDLFGVQIPTKSDIAAGFAEFAAENVVAVFVQPILDLAVAPLATAQLTLLEEVHELVLALRDIDSSQNITAQVTDLVLDWLAAQIREAFAEEDPGVEFNNLFGISLGFVGFPLDDLVATVRSTVRSLAAFETVIRNLVDQIQTILEAEEMEAALRLQEEAERIRQQEVEMMLTESHLTNVDVLILEPSASAEYRDDLEIEIFLEGVPYSYLGLGEATVPRVFMLLNDEQLALSEFTVEEHTAASSNETVTAEFVAAEILSIVQELEEVENVTPVLQSALLKLDNNQSNKHGQETRAGMRRIIHSPGAHAGFFGQLREVDKHVPVTTKQSPHTVTRDPTPNRISERRIVQVVPSPSPSSRLGARHARHLHAPQIPRQQSHNTQVTKSRKTEALHDLINRPGRVRLTSHVPKTRNSSRTVAKRMPSKISKNAHAETAQAKDKFTVDKDLVGRILTVNEREEILADSGSGLLLKRRIPIEALKEGINTLSVAVANGATVIENGQQTPLRIQEAVSFMITPSEEDSTRRRHTSDDLYVRLPKLLRDALHRDERLGRTDPSPRQPVQGKGNGRPQPTDTKFSSPPRAVRYHQSQVGIKQMSDAMQSKTRLLRLYGEALKDKNLAYIDKERRNFSKENI